MKYVRNKSVFSKEIKGVYYILEFNKESVRELNDVASFIWSLLEKPKGLEELQNSVTKKYKISKKIANRDIEEFVNSYLKEGYIVKS